MSRRNKRWFSVKIDEEFLESFDKKVFQEGFESRSYVIKKLMEKYLRGEVRLAKA